MTSAALEPVFFLALTFFLTSKLVSRLKRPLRSKIGRHVSCAVLSASLFSYSAVRACGRLFSGAAGLSYLEPGLVVLEAALGAFSVYWLLLRKRWRALGVSDSFSRITVCLTVPVALLFWLGLKTEAESLFRQMFEYFIFFFAVLPIFISMEWRLSITPVPRRLRGQPILMISAGLLGMALLGLSHFF